MNALKMEPIIETKQEEEPTDFAISPLQTDDKVRISIFVDNRFFQSLPRLRIP